MNSETITIASQKHLLGWEDVIKERFYTTSTRCLSCKGTLLKIEASDFIRNTLRDSSTSNMFVNLSHERDDLTKNKIMDVWTTQRKLSVPVAMLNPQRGHDSRSQLETGVKYEKSYVNIIKKYNLR